jgi:hypothetical protein
VHVIVNRVHPVTGKAATFSNSMLKLSEWAEAYERERGEILCPRRVENNARRRRGAFLRHPRQPQPAFELSRAVERKAAFGPFADREAVRRKARVYRMGLTRPRHGDERFGPKPPTPDF